MERAAPAGSSRSEARGHLRRELILGVPSLGLALATTTLAAYLPVLARDLSASRTVIGVLVGGEGFVSLVLPIWIGIASDRLDSPLGRRLPFLLATAPVAAAALVLMPFSGSILLLGIEAFVFYLASFSYFGPYRALYADVIPPERAGRAQGIWGMFQGAGTGAALVGGALLLPLWRPLPYLAGGFVLVVTTIALAVESPDARRRATGPPAAPVGKQLWSLLGSRHDILRILLANVLWQLTEGGLKTFIVLYLTRGLQRSFDFSAGIMAIIAAAALVAAPLAGKAADRFGGLRVMRVLLVVFGVGLWLPAFSRSTVVLLAVLPIVGVGGAMALSLPYAILMPRLPRQRSHGVAAALFDLSHGAGTLLGPLLTGFAIDLMHPWFASTDGYAAMWPVIGTASLASIAVIAGLHDERPGSPSASST